MKTQNIAEIKIGGAKRKNGHKLHCTCHICENIRNKAKRGGYEEEAEKEELKKMGGSKKKNGHKPDCKCPICINMKNAKKSINNIKTIKSISGGKKSKTRKIHKGGQDEETSEEIGEEKEEEQEELADDKVFPDEGGKKRKGNNHKLDCKCPICKNMRKKGGQEPEQEESKVVNQIENNETPASPSDYDEIEKEISGGTRKYKKKGGKKTRRSKSRKH